MHSVLNQAIMQVFFIFGKEFRTKLHQCYQGRRDYIIPSTTTGAI